MNPIYARNALNRVTASEHTLEDDRDAIHMMAAELRKAYEAGQDNPYTELYGKIRKVIDKSTRIEEVHVIGKHVIVETLRPIHEEEGNLFGVWAPEERDGKGRVLCYHYSLDEALLVSISLQHGKKDKRWDQSNQEAFYAGMILGMERGE